MRMITTLKDMKKLSAEDFEFEYPEFKRISGPNDEVLEIECESPECLGEFIAGVVEYPALASHHGQTMYRYQQGLRAIWYQTLKAYKFYEVKKLIAIFYLK